MSTFEGWSVLGIEPTKDEAVIREAYLNALPGFHPEDDPAGFMKLRAAYEAALKITRDTNDVPQGSGTEDSADESGGESIRDDLFDGILSDFPRRVKEEEWEKIFALYGTSLDRLEELSEKLLIALMGGQYLPRRIWLLFEKTFSWAVRSKQLKEKFSSGYIEYVLNGMRYERAVRDVFFDYEKDADEDFDSFIRDYHSLSEILSQGDMKKAEELVASGTGCLYKHPDYQLLVSRFHRLNEDYGEEQKILGDLDAAWPEDPYIRAAVGEMLLKDAPEESVAIFKEVLGTDPEHYGARIGLARAYFAAGKPEEAKAGSYELLMSDPYDGNAMNVFGAANEALIPVFSERLEKDPGDMEARYKLSSCLFNLGRYEESLDLIAETEPDEKNRAKHYELYADLFAITTSDMTDEDREILLEYLKAWEKAETDRQRMKFLPEKYHRLGLSDMAMEKAEIMLAELPHDPELCRVRAQIFKERGDDFNAFSAVAEGLEKNPSHAALLAVEALLLEETGNIGAAVDSANAALSGFPYYLDMWELIGRVYERIERYEDVLQTVRHAEEFGLSSDALSLMKAVALFETGDPEEEAQGLFEEYIEKEPYDPVCLEKLSIIYAKKGRAADAAGLADLFVEKHGIPFAYLLRGWLYAVYPQTSDGFAKARARSDFRKALEINDRYAPAWYQLGVLAYDEGRMAEAAADFQLTLDIDPGFTDVHFYLAVAYDRMGDITSALRILDEGIALTEEREADKIHTRLLLKKADLLYEHHKYKELAELGEKPADAEENRESATSRRAELAHAYYEIYEDEKAEQMFSRVFDEIKQQAKIETDKFLWSLYSNYAGFLRYSKRDIRTAIEYYKKSLDGNNTMRSVVWLAKAYKAAGDGKEAAKLFKKALKMNLKDYYACTDYLYGECWFGLGQIKKAEAFFKQAIAGAAGYEGCPKRCCYEAEFALGLIALQKGDIGTARWFYNKVLETVQDRDYRESAALFGL